MFSRLQVLHLNICLPNMRREYTPLLLSCCQYLSTPTNSFYSIITLSHYWSFNQFCFEMIWETLLQGGVIVLLLCANCWSRHCMFQSFFLLSFVISRGPPNWQIIFSCFNVDSSLQQQCSMAWNLTFSAKCHWCGIVLCPMSYLAAAARNTVLF